jgi:hypothetical protein
MYNLRYHIVSLVAVFVALTVGLLLGSIVVERGLLSSQQTTLVEGLQAEFDTLRTESADLKTANDALSAFASDAAPGVVQGVLDGRTVIVLASPETADTAARTSEAIRLAGGKAAVATFTGARLSLDDEAVVTAVATELSIATDSVDATRVTSMLAVEWSTPDAPRPLTRALIASGGLKLSGLTTTSTVGGTAIAAVFGGTPDPWAIRLARSMTDTSRFAVGVDTTKRNDGSAKAAREAGLSGVDDVDTALGRVSFAWVLCGRAAGLFGQQEGATARYPSPLFGK